MSKKRMADGLLTALNQAVDMEKGRLKGRSTVVKLAKPAPRWTSAAIKKLRKNQFNMSQPHFAALLNVSTATIRSWEQGQRKPDGASARLLQILSKDHSIVEMIA